MAETFDAVLAECARMYERTPIARELHGVIERLRAAHDVEAAAHAAEVAERDARIAELDAHAADRESEIEAIKAERQKAEDEAEAAERDAGRYRWLRERLAAEELTDEDVAIFALRTVGPIALRPADDDDLPSVDAAIDAMLPAVRDSDSRVGAEGK